MIATPYNTNFDHLRIADEAQFKFDRTLRAYGSDLALLPVYGVGHSLGATMQLLISSRYSLSVSSRPPTCARMFPPIPKPCPCICITATT